MKYGARYTVKTHWGVFALDEGAYQDYLAGKLWISWVPGKANVGDGAAAEPLPKHVSMRALELRDSADRRGIWAVLEDLAVSSTAPPPFSERLAEVGIDELNLTVRAGNGLMRAGASTFGKLYALMCAEKGIASVRNLGQKSVREIRLAYYTECYQRMKPHERALYWQAVVEML